MTKHCEEFTTVRESQRSTGAAPGQHRGSTGAAPGQHRGRTLVGKTSEICGNDMNDVLIVGLVLVLVLLLELSTCDMFSIRFAAANLCHVVSVSINSYSLASPLTRRKLLKLKT